MVNCMAKVHWRDVPAEERHKMVQELAGLFLSCDNKRDMAQLLHRLFTRSEIVMLGRRMQIGELLVRGWPYRDIQDELHVGIPTIRLVDGLLEHFVRDYIDIREEERARRRREKSRTTRIEYTPGLPGSFDHIRQAYSGHFWILNMMIDAARRGDGGREAEGD